MNRELVQELRNYNFVEQLKLNCLVDAIDENKWKVARIVAINSHGHRQTVTLRFDGYSSKWNEVFDLPASNKLAPFRRHTLPYTGPSSYRIQIYRDTPSMDFSEPLANISKMGKHKDLKPEFINQFFRGDLFILIDNLLTRRSQLHKEQYERTIELFKAYIQCSLEVIAHCLNIIPEISKESTVDPNVINVSAKHALVYSLAEVFFSLNSLVSKKEERVKFFQANRIHSPAAQASAPFKQMLISHKIIDRCKAVIEYQNAGSRGFPWSVKKEALILLAELEPKYPFPQVSDIRESMELLDFLKYLGSKQAYPQEVIMKKQLSLVINLIVNGNFEGKLRGLNDLKKLIDDVRSRKQLLKAEIVACKVLETMTENKTFNGQLFRRSIPLFEFAEQENLLTEEMLNRVLSLQKDKSELELKAYYNTLSCFGKFLKNEQCVTFFNKIIKFPLEEHFVTLIQDYTFKTINEHRYFQKSYMEKNTGFGAQYFWALIISKENLKIDEELMDKIANAFSKLISNIYYKKQSERYIRAAILGIKQRHRVDAFLRIIRNWLKKSHTIPYLIQSLDKEMSIVDSVIKSVTESGKLSDRNLENMFEFFEEVDHYVQKKMTVEHMKVLWNLPGTRPYLLKFMRKYRSSKYMEKSTDKILCKQLNENQIRDFVEKIFLSAEMMGGYTDISEQLLQTIDELLIAYNFERGYIDYNFKFTIRTKRADELFGTRFYLQVVESVKSEKIAVLAVKKFIEFYLRPFERRSSMIQMKIGLWMACAGQLNKLSRRKYMAFDHLFEGLNGRMKSLSILESTPIHLKVLLKSENIYKTITLPRYSSLWKLRLVINEVFDLRNTDFHLYFPVKLTSTDMEKEEDFSLALIELPRDPSAPAVVVTPSREPHHHFKAMEGFKQRFCQEYGDKLYDSLQESELPLQESIVRILFKLPIIKKLETKISKLQEKDWEGILSSRNTAKLGYQLLTIQKVKAGSSDWVIKFLNSRGLEQILKILAHRNQIANSLKPFQHERYTEVLSLFTEIIRFHAKMVNKPLPFTADAVKEILPNRNSDVCPQMLHYYFTVFNCFRELAAFEEINIPNIFNSGAMTAILELLLFNVPPATDAAKRFPSNIITICRRRKCQEALLMNFEGFMGLSFLENKRKTSRVFFDVLIQMYADGIMRDILYKKMNEFLKSVRKSEYSEDSEESVDQILLGYLKITKCFTLQQISKKINEKPEQSYAIAQFLIQEGLFGQNPKYRSLPVRDEAYQVLTNLPCEKHIVTKMEKILLPILLKAPWRVQDKWFVKSFQKRQPDQVVGLKNLAATCYINSLLQQLFFIWQFSEPLLSVPGKSIDDPENIVSEIQQIFALLKYSDSTVHSTESLCSVFLQEGQPINPRVQTDVDEFFHSLMDKLERNLMRINQKQIIDDVFKGEYSNLIIGQECPHKSERFEHFLSMRLEILNKKSLTQALEDFIKGQVLEGDNAYHCSKCEKKVKALKRVCVKSLPQVLILTLKRFEFNFDTMQKFKLNSYCEFPEQLDMFPYTREALDNNEDKKDPGHYQYMLKGTVIHCGVSQAGHYTSYIRTNDKTWKYFDDDKIFPFQIEDLSKQCFGGKQQSMDPECSDKIKNSYLLIYEKVNTPKRTHQGVNPQLIKEVENDNKLNQTVQQLFENGLLKYMKGNYQKFPKMFIIYVHLVFLRSESRSKHLASMYENCVCLFESVPELSKWYLDQFSEAIIKEFLIFSYFEASYFVASLIIHCLKKTVNVQFILRCMKCLQQKNMCPLNRVFQAAATINSAYRKALAQLNFGEKILSLIKSNKPPNNANVANIPDVQSQFGAPAKDFTEKHDFRNPIELVAAIDKFKVGTLTLEDIDVLSSRTKNPNIQVSLAKLVARKFTSPDGFDKLEKEFIRPKLTNFEPKIEEEYMFQFVIILIDILCEVEDDHTKKRNQVLAELYLAALTDYASGYKAERYLIEGLFSIAFSRLLFLAEFSALLNFNKKATKTIKDWIKDSDKMYYYVKDRRLGYWRHPTSNYYVPQAQLESIDRDKKISTTEWLSLFNSLIQKKPIEYSEKWIKSISQGDKVTEKDNYGWKVYTVATKAGLLVHVKDSDNNYRYLPEQDLKLLDRV